MEQTTLDRVAICKREHRDQKKPITQNFFGKPYIQPVAPNLPSISFGWWSEIEQMGQVVALRPQAESLES